MQIISAFLFPAIEAVCCTIVFRMFIEREVTKKWTYIISSLLQYIEIAVTAILELNHTFWKPVLLIPLLFITESIFSEVKTFRLMLLCVANFALIQLLDDVFFYLFKNYEDTNKLNGLDFKIPENIVYIIITILGLLIGMYLIYRIVNQEQKKSKTKQNIRLAEEHAKGQIALYTSMNEFNINERRKIHDFKNQIGCIEGLLSSGAYLEAREYARTLNQNLIEEGNYINVGHAVINSIMNQKFKEAKKKKIRMVFQLSHLDQINIKDEDIVILLTNLLDNAIEACERIYHLSNENSRLIIKVRFVQEKDRIVISTKNPIVDEQIKINGKLLTTKDDKNSHGFGLLNIQYVINKYHGEDIISTGKGFFTHTVILKVG